MKSMERIYAMVLRYIYLLRGSWPRILELFYWPAVQLILWGFISQFFVTNSTWVAQASGVLMAAVLLVAWSFWLPASGGEPMEPEGEAEPA